MKRVRWRWALVASLALLTWPAPASALRLASSPVTNVFVEPAAGYGFFSAAILSAHHDIDLSMYELKDPTIEAQLVRMAHSGVRVRVLLNSDHYGRADNAPAASVLRRGAVAVTWAPVGQIFHAKFLVIDDARVYIGTGNLVEYYYSSTRDVWVLDQVGADVSAVEATFSSDVAGAEHTPVTRGGLVWSPGSSSVVLSLIGSARHTLLIENEEMNDVAVERALDAAATRGVRVTVVMVDSTRYLGALRDLVRHGVRVDLLAPSPVYVHAKVICVDCAATSGTVFVGSENFSASSLDRNRELGVVTRSLGAIDVIWPTLLADAAAGASLGV